MNYPLHLVTPEYPPEAGGVSDFSSLLTEGFARRGIGIEVWCPTAGEATQLPGIPVHPTLGDFGPSALANTDRELGLILNEVPMPDDTESTDAIAYVSAPHCPMCGSHGDIWTDRARDSFTHMAGEWSYRQCSSCETVWMDPRPSAKSVPLLYPSTYYTHSSHVPESGGSPSRSRRIRDALASQVYGYGSRTQVGWGWLEQLAGVLSQIRYFRRRAGYAFRFLPALPNGRLLDVGCGNGNLLSAMRDRGWDVCGIEPDPLAAEAARAEGFRVERTTAEDAKVPAGHFDAIVMTDVLEHLIDPKKALSDLYAGLAPGGRLVTVTPNALGAYAIRYKRWWCDLDPPRHLVFPSPQSFEQLLVPLGAIVKTFTISRSGRAVIQQSENLREFDYSNRYGARSRWRLLLRRGIIAIGECFRNTAGSELVCIATKP